MKAIFSHSIRSANWTTQFTKQQPQQQPITTCSLLTNRVDEQPHRRTGEWAVTHWLLRHQQEITDFPFTWLRIRHIYCSINSWLSSMRQQNLNDTPAHPQPHSKHCRHSQPTSQASSPLGSSACSTFGCNVRLSTSSHTAAPTATMLPNLLYCCIYLRFVCAFFALTLFHCTATAEHTPICISQMPLLSTPTVPTVVALQRKSFSHIVPFHRESRSGLSHEVRSPIWHTHIYVLMSACSLHLGPNRYVVSCLLRILINLPHFLGIRQLQLSRA